MGKSKNELVIGGIYIPFTGTTNLYDFITGTDTGQDLIDQAYAATPTLYIEMHPKVKCFKIIGYRYGYVDGATVNDIASVHLFEGAEAADDTNQRKAIPIAITSLIETPVSAQGTYVEIDTPIPVRLDDAGILYFIMNWTTAVISCGAAEHLFFVIYGESMEDSI